jgi:hypothetical protein
LSRSRECRERQRRTEPHATEKYIAYTVMDCGNGACPTACSTFGTGWVYGSRPSRQRSDARKHDRSCCAANIDLQSSAVGCGGSKSVLRATAADAARPNAPHGITRME